MGAARIRHRGVGMAVDAPRPPRRHYATSVPQLVLRRLVPIAITFAAACSGDGGTVGGPTPVTTSCSGVTPITIAVGEVRVLAGNDRSRICLDAGGAAREFMLLVLNNSLDTMGATVGVSLDPKGTIAATGAPSLQDEVVPAFSPDMPRNRSLDAALRRLEHGELATRLRANRRSGALAAAGIGHAGSRASLKGVNGIPPVGTQLTLNTSSTSACTTPDLHTGRVVAISSASIIVVDTGAPPNGFTDVEYAAFGTTFDTLVLPVDTLAFGGPTDMDGNGRVVIFFTQAVNQLTAPSATSVFGGYFHPRDLFPVAGTATLGACATSNEAEMFYVPVLDPASKYNPYFKSKSLLLGDMIGTLAHEFQHLINAGHRMYINDADDFESPWLNEGLSHLAEELMFYRAAGLGPKGDLNLAAITAGQRVVDAANTYQVDNLLRVSAYLKAPDQSSPYADNELLATRGATWQFLRYVLDRAPASPNTYLRALVSAKTNGMANLIGVFGPVFSGGVRDAFQGWAVAQYVDNTGLNADVRYAHASWNFRSVLTSQLGNTGYPLQPRMLLDGAVQSFSLAGGAVAYTRFRVAASGGASIVPSTIPATTDLILVRTQ